MQIARYDESLYDPRAVNLVNYIDTVDIEVPVGFSYPTGSFRLSEPNNIGFTHFTADIPALQISANDQWRVFKITRLVCINSKVTEYYYDLDYLKDYWYAHMQQSGSFHILPLPNTLISSSYNVDESTNTEEKKIMLPVNQKVQPIITDVAEAAGNKTFDPRPYLVTKSAIGVMAPTNPEVPSRWALKDNQGKVLNTKGLYYFPSNDLLPYFFSKFLAVSPSTGQDFSDLYGNIEAAYYGPDLNLADLGCIVHNDSNNIYYINESGGHDAMECTGEIKDKLYYVNLPTDGDCGIVYAALTTGLTVSIKNGNDLPPYKKYEIYVPYVGWYDLPIAEIYPFVNGKSAVESVELIANYQFNLLDGTVAVRIGAFLGYDEGQPIINLSSFVTPYVPLPNFAMPTSNYATSTIANQNNRDSGMISNAISSLGCIAPAIVTGNPLMALPGIAVSTITKALNTNASYEQAQANAHLGNFTSGKDSGGMGSIDRRFRLRINYYDSCLSYNRAAELYGFPVNSYVDYVRFTDNSHNAKLWLDAGNSKIKGPEWYAEQVRNELNKNYITYVYAS